MNIIDRALSFGRKGSAQIRRFGTMNNANKFLTGANLGLKPLGSYASKGQDFYNRARSVDLIPETSVGTNAVKVLDTPRKNYQ